MSESNKATIRSLFAAIDHAQDMAPLDGFAASTYVAHFTGAPTMDREGMKGFGNSFFSACPGLRHELEHVMAEGDTVAMRLTVRGRHTRPFMTPNGALPPKDKDFEMPVINMFRFADGKIAEHWAVFDMMGFMQQITG